MTYGGVCIDGGIFMNNSKEITKEMLLDALDSVTWYNGLAEELIKWTYDGYLDHCIGTPGWLKPNYYNIGLDSYDEAQLQVIWIICVILFGDYGTSPRYGWIEDVEGFKQFIHDITVTERSNMWEEK